ncbi:hypothetical protein T484DRAFT_1824194 [Baffinella frigidus]|nr:hypothetical protein T484DRAFT_1824194 [Cryptophyta sp. CCMP2293]
MATIPGRLCSRGLALLVAIGLLHGCCSDSTWQQNANGPDYGGTDSPTGDDVWVSCNPTTGAFRGATSGFAMGTGGLDIPTGGGIGTQDSPALSCTDLARLPHFSSGMYWLFPPGAEKAFRGWCDMDSFGGGWLVCYTSEGGVHMATETESDAEFPADGYRSDCRDLPFNQVMYIKHGERASDEDDKAWFSFQGSSGLVARRSNFRGAVDASCGEDPGLGSSK